MIIQNTILPATVSGDASLVDTKSKSPILGVEFGAYLPPDLQELGETDPHQEISGGSAPAEHVADPRVAQTTIISKISVQVTFGARGDTHEHRVGTVETALQQNKFPPPVDKGKGSEFPAAAAATAGIDTDFGRLAVPETPITPANPGNENGGRQLAPPRKEQENTLPITIPDPGKSAEEKSQQFHSAFNDSSEDSEPRSMLQFLPRDAVKPVSQGVPELTPQSSGSEHRPGASGPAGQNSSTIDFTVVPSKGFVGVNIPGEGTKIPWQEANQTTARGRTEIEIPVLSLPLAPAQKGSKAGPIEFSTPKVKEQNAPVETEPMRVEKGPANIEQQPIQTDMPGSVKNPDPRLNDKMAFFQTDKNNLVIGSKAFSSSMISRDTNPQTAIELAPATPISAAPVPLTSVAPSPNIPRPVAGIKQSAVLSDQGLLQFEPFQELAISDVLTRSVQQSGDFQIIPASRADHSPRVIQMIADAARVLHDKPVEITLSPEELGKVRLTMLPSDTAMTVHVSVERPETLELLRRNIELLASELRDLGFEDISFDFANQNDTGAGREDDPSKGNTEGPNMPIVAEDPSKQPQRIYLGEGVGIDIRL